MTDRRIAQRVYTAAAALFIAFAVWGSLFPFDFRAVAWGDAAASFWSTWNVPVARWSISDVVSNVLLFVPIGLFAAASLRGRAGASFQGARATGAPQGRFSMYAGVVAAALGLSVVIELAQACVPWRTPSIVDVGAETVGAACGVALWVLLRRPLDALTGAAIAVVRRSPPAERWLLAYCVVFAVAWLVPADFTLRPNEIADKYLHKRLLLPFTPSPDAAGTAGLAVIGAAALPVGVTATLCGCGGAARRSIATALLIATTYLVALEAAQVFVFSRTTDGTAFLVAGGAAVAAALIAAAGARRPVAVRVEGR